MGLKFVGLGTGRCGTRSLAALFRESGLVCTHEELPHLPWQFDEQQIDERYKKIRRGEGDVAFYYLPYADYLLAKGVKMVCMKRNKGDTIKSFIKKIDGRNHFNNTGNTMDKCFPDYNMEIEPALRRYWDEYYFLAETYEQDYPHLFRVFDIDTLNTDKESILEFIHAR